MIGIIGAGISGLTAAWHLQKAGQPYFLLEAAPEPGGYIQSRQEGPYLLELGANSLLLNAADVTWLHELGLGDELLPANSVSKNRYLYRRGRYRVLPAHPLKLLLSNYFSWPTKRAILRELSNRTRTHSNETLSDFFERRFSRELVDYAVAPFVGGIYAGHPDQLLASQTFPVLADYETRYGSVLKGFRKENGGQRRQSLSFRSGMAALPRAVAAGLTQLHLGTAVSELRRLPTGWAAVTPRGTFTCRQLLLTGSAPACAGLLEPHFPAIATALRAIYYPPLTVVHSAYRRSDVNHPLDGFGGLNPPVEGLFTSGSIWSSSVFAGRCPTNEVLFTTFTGGVGRETAAQLEPSLLKQRVHEELSQNYGIRASGPVFSSHYHWPQAIPQYNAAQREAATAATGLAPAGIHFCTNWKDGVSLSDCLRKGREIAALRDQ